MAKISTMAMRLFFLGLLKIPQIGFTRPKLLFLNREKVQILIRLNRRTKNHLGSMYFGALAVGADIAAGIHVFEISHDTKEKISFSFKSINSVFLKRAESDVLFECNDGMKIYAAVEESRVLGKRVNEIVIVKAYNLEKEQVAEFEMTISIKVII